MRTGLFVRTIGRQGDAPGEFFVPRGVATVSHPLRHGKEISLAGSGSGVVVDGAITLLDSEVLLVVCEQRRVQVRQQTAIRQDTPVHAVHRSYL